MIEILIPGYKTFRFQHLVLDVNGTIAKDGHLIDGTKELFSGAAIEARNPLDNCRHTRQSGRSSIGNWPWQQFKFPLKTRRKLSLIMLKLWARIKSSLWGTEPMMQP